MPGMPASEIVRTGSARTASWPIRPSHLVLAALATLAAAFALGPNELAPLSVRLSVALLAVSSACYAACLVTFPVTTAATVLRYHPQLIHAAIALAAAVITCVLHPYNLPVDDAAIIMRYLENLRDGYVYRYNPQDPPIFGVSSPIHYLVAGIFTYTDILSPKNSLYASNFIGLCGVYYLTFRILAYYINDPRCLYPSWAFTVLTAQTFLLTTRIGMEAPLHLALVLAAFRLFQLHSRWVWPMLTLIVVSKLDAVPVALLLGVCALFRDRPIWMQHLRPNPLWNLDSRFMHRTPPRLDRLRHMVLWQPNAAFRKSQTLQSPRRFRPTLCFHRRHARPPLDNPLHRHIPGLLHRLVCKKTSATQPTPVRTRRYPRHLPISHLQSRRKNDVVLRAARLPHKITGLPHPVPQCPGAPPTPSDHDTRPYPPSHALPSPKAPAGRGRRALLLLRTRPMDTAGQMDRSTRKARRCRTRRARLSRLERKPLYRRRKRHQLQSRNSGCRLDTIIDLVDPDYVFTNQLIGGTRHNGAGYTLVNSYYNIIEYGEDPWRLYQRVTSPHTTADLRIPQNWIRSSGPIDVQTGWQSTLLWGRRVIIRLPTLASAPANSPSAFSSASHPAMQPLPSIHNPQMNPSLSRSIFPHAFQAISPAKQLNGASHYPKPRSKQSNSWLNTRIPALLASSISIQSSWACQTLPTSPPGAFPPAIPVPFPFPSPE